MVVTDGDYAVTQESQDFKDAKITAQQGVYLYNLIDQIPDVSKQTAMGDFCYAPSPCIWYIDGCVSDGSKTAEEASSKYKMITLKDGGFQVSETASKWNKSRSLLESAKSSVKLMDHIIAIQPADKTDELKGKLL